MEQALCSKGCLESDGFALVPLDFGIAIQWRWNATRVVHIPTYVYHQSYLAKTWNLLLYDGRLQCLSDCIFDITSGWNDYSRTFEEYAIVYRQLIPKIVLNHLKLEHLPSIMVLHL